MDQQQDQTQAQGQAGTPAQVPAPSPNNQNQPRSLEERQEAWNRLDGMMLNSMASATVTLQIAEDQVVQFERQLSRLQEQLNIRRRALSNIREARASWANRRERNGNDLPDGQLRSLGTMAEQYQNDARMILDLQTQAIRDVVEGQQAWMERHQAQIQEYQRWPEQRTATEQIARYNDDRDVRYHESRTEPLLHQLNWAQNEYGFNRQCIDAMRPRQQTPNPQTPQQMPQPPDASSQAPVPEPQQPAQRLANTPNHLERPFPWLPKRSQQSRAAIRTEQRSHPYRIGGAAAPWTQEEEDWLVIHTMYGYTTEWMAVNIPGGRGRTRASLNSHLADMRMRGRLPSSWTIRASGSYVDPWTMTEDVELMRWHSRNRVSIDFRVFLQHNRSGAAAYRRARFLLEDEELALKVIEIENRRQARATLPGQDGSGDTGMAGVGGADRDEQATAELREAISQSLAHRAPMGP